MRTEYLLLCKKNYYSDSGNTFVFLNLFKKPMFLKGQKYKVVKEVITFPYSTSNTSAYSTTSTTPSPSGSTSILIANPPSYSGLTSTTTTSIGSTTTTTTSTTYPASYNWTSYTINSTQISETFISDYFYTLREERQIKLSKLKEVNEKEEIL